MTKALITSFIVMIVAFQAHAESDYSYALKDYVQESYDYVNTLRTNKSEIRTWRSLYLAERFEGKLRALEVTLLESNKQIIEQVENSIKEGGLESLDDILLLRMAQVYFERENLILSRKMKQYETELKAFLDGRLKKSPDLPTPNFRSTIQYCKTLLTRYPRSPLSDKTHYLMAYALDEMGEYDGAIDIYKRFIRRHPYSPLIDEVRWRVAEHYFDTRELSKAAYFYDLLSKKEGSEFQLKALYKLGAAYFAGSKYKVAGEKFSELYRKTKESLDDNHENETLYDESLEYLGIIQSYGVVINIDKDVLDEATKRLALAFQRMPNEKKAREVYVQFMKKEPYSPRVPSFANSVIESYLNEGILRGADSMREKLVSFLTRKDTWWKKNFFNRNATFEAEDLLERYLITSAQSHAQIGIEKKNNVELKKARLLYSRFLKEYPYSPLVGRARYELAQVEYVTGLYESAAENFNLAMNDPSIGSYLEDAAYGYLWSIIKKSKYPMDQDRNLDVKRSSNGDLLPPQPLSEKDKAFLAAAQVFVGKIPSGPRRQKVLYKVAEVHFLNNNFDLAEKAIDLILEDRGAVSLTTAKALRLSAEISNIKGDWQAVAQKNNQILSLSFATDIGGMDDVQTVTPGAQALDSANLLEKSGQKLEAANEYSRIAGALPNASFSSYANWKAANLYREERKFKNSNANAEQLKNSEYAAEALFIKANNMKSLMAFEKSAQLFDDFIAKYPRHAWIGEAVFTAANLRRDLKQYNKAADLFVKYHDLTNVDAVLFEAMDLYGKVGKVRQAQQLANRIPKNSIDGVVRAKGVLAEIYWSQPKQQGRVVNECKDAIRIGQKMKSKSAQIVRTEALCRYFDISLQVKKSGITAKVTESLEKLITLKQKDLIGRAYADIGERLVSESKPDDAIKFLDKGWTAIDKNPYSEVGSHLYELLLKVSDTYHINYGVLTNWRIAQSELFIWAVPPTQQLAWGNTRSLCEREFYTECLEQIDGLIKQQESDELLINKVIAALRSGRDSLAKDTLNYLGKKTEWPLSIQRMAILSGFDDLLPKDKKTIDTTDSLQREVALTARARLYINQGDYKKALLDLQDAVMENSEYSGAYIVLARLFHETGHYELMQSVLKEGAKNTNSRAGLYGLSQYWEAVLAPESPKTFKEVSDQLTSHALYGVAMSAHIWNQEKTYEAIASIMEKKGILSSDLRSTVTLLNKPQAVNLDSNTIKLNAHLLLLGSFSKNKTEALDYLAQSAANGLPMSKFIRDYNEVLKR